MATDQFLHGIETIENDSGGRPVQTVKSSIIGLIGTAPNADAGNWPLNTPVAIVGERGVPEGLGAAGTLKDALDAIFDQSSATVVAVRVTEGENIAATIANIIGDRNLRTGVHAFSRAGVDLGLKPRMFIAPGFTGVRPTNGAASITVTDGGEGYVSAPAVTFAAGEGGTVPVGLAAHAVIEDGEVTEIIIDNPGIGGTAPVNVVFTGGGASAAATATVALGTVANPVVAELLGLAERMRAMIAVEGPNTTKEAAITYRDDWGSDRIMVIDPFVQVWKGAGVVTQPASARVVGLQAKIDNSKGFWHSPSNHVLNGVIGIARPIDWALNDRETEANYLNENHVTTIIRDYEHGGFKLWGNRVTSGDTLKLFWSVRRTHDMIIESIELATLTYIDRPFSLQAMLDVAETVNSYLRSLRARGAILGGRVWLNPELNTPDQLAAGKLFVSYDAEGPAPMEHIIFEFNRNTGYYRELTEQAAREIARLAA